MRGATLGRRFSCPGATNTATTTFARAIPFSTSSGGGGGGRGRGRGHGVTSTPFDFARPSPPPPDETPKRSPPPSSSAPVTGRGRGIPRPPPPSPSPSFPQSPSFGSAMGRGRPDSPHPQKQPVFFKRADSDVDAEVKRDKETASSIPQSIASVLSGGSGRGKPIKTVPGAAPVVGQVEQKREPEPPRLSREEAVKKAMGILSRREDGGGGRGRREIVGGRGRGRGRGSGREVKAAFRGRGRGRGRDESDDEDVGYAGLVNAGEDKGGEILAERFGPEFMSKLVEGFEEMSDRVLPSPADDVYIDALHTNCLIEFEPEYLMEEFGTNPDIDEKPPIPLRDALEKMKPFLMVYEGIKDQAEWEQVMKETMDRVPLIKEIVDYYSGPDRITAKKQQEELERISKKLPASAPASVKHFADRAVLSLQSNPGWKFDQKCQFMDKLVREVSQQYK